MGRRIVPPEVGGLYFAGFLDAPGGLLPVVEAQGKWIAAVLTGRLHVPRPAQMRRAIERGERRTRQRFPEESPCSIRCDPHAYRRLLQADLRRAQRGRWRAATAAAVATVRPGRHVRESPQPNVKQYTSTPASRNSISKRRFEIGPGCLIS